MSVEEALRYYLDKLSDEAEELRAKAEATGDPILKAKVEVLDAVIMELSVILGMI